MNNDTVIIELDRPRELRFGHKAQKKLCSMTGKPIVSFDKIDDLDIETIEKMYFCGLEQDAVAHGESLKLDQIEDMLDAVPTWMLYDKLIEAFGKAFTPPKAEEENADKAEETERKN